MNLNLSAEVLEALSAMADEERRSRSQMANLLLERVLGEAGVNGSGPAARNLPAPASPTTRDDHV